MRKTTKMLALASVFALLMTGCAKELPVVEEEVTATETTDEEVVEEVTTIVPEEGAQLLLWTDNLEYGEGIVAGFNALYPDVTITTEEVGFSDARTRMELDGPAGTGADVFMISHSRLNTAISSGMLEPIVGDVEVRLKETLTQTAIDTATKEGVLYGVPISTEANAIFYNKDIVETPAQTFEEIFEFAETYNDIANNKFGYMMSTSDAYASYGMLSAYGYQLFGEGGLDQDNPGFDSEEFIKGLGFMESMREILPVQSADLTNEFISELFKQGNAAYVLGGPWNIKDFQEAGVNFGVIEIPTIEGNTPTPFAGLKVAHVSVYTEYPNASMLLTEFMASEEGAKILYDTNYKASTIKNVDNVEGLSTDEHLLVFANQFANAFPAPNLERMSYYYSIGQKTLSLVYDGQLTPEEAAKTAMEEWNSLVASE